MKTTLKIAVVCLVVSMGSGAWATIPWPYVESIDTPGLSSSQPVSIFVLPDGSGSLMTEAQIVGDGTVVDATVVIAMVDLWFNVIADFPKEDVWLDWQNSQQFFCAAGFSPDDVSSIHGEMVFSGPFHGGGWSTGPVWVYVNGSPAYDPLFAPDFVALPPVNLWFNSADIDGDGQVTLTDVGLFASDFFNEYHYRSDFYCDGVLNLVDIGRMASGLGTSCP